MLTPESRQSRVKSFLESAHADIDGWFFPLDHFAFIESYNLHCARSVAGSIVEVGVWHGKSLTLLSLLRNSSEEIFGFDLYKDNHEEITSQNVSQFGDDEDISLVRGLTSDLTDSQLESLLTRPIRFLHIDAGHEYHEVLEQLYIFSPFLCDEAIIAMDDFQDREFPGVSAAVLDFAEVDRPRRFVPFMAGGNKMYLCSPSQAAKNQEFFVSRNLFSGKTRLTRMRDFNVLILQSKLPVADTVVLEQIQATAFPVRSDSIDLHGKARAFGQIKFGSGK